MLPHGRPRSHRALVHTAHTSLMTGGVRIGSNKGGDRAARGGDEQACEERGGSEAIREQLMPSTPIPPYTHLSSTTSRTGMHTPAHQVHPSRRPTCAQFEHPNTSQDFEATAPADPTPAPPLVLAPRPAQQQQQGTNDERTPAARRVYGYHPVFPSSFSPPSVQCQRRLRRLARSLQTLTHTQGPYAWYGVSAIGNAYTPAPDTDANNGQGTSVLFPIAAISPLTLAAAALLRTGTSHNGSNTRPYSFRRTSLMTPDPPRPAYLLFTSPQPAAESHLRLDCTSLSATVVDSGPSKRSRSHTRTRVLEPARSDSDRIERPTHPQGQRYGEHRGRCRGWCLRPDVGIRPARVGIP